MKKLMMTAASAALLVATGGASQAAEQLIYLNANIASTCSIGGTGNPNAKTISLVSNNNTVTDTAQELDLDLYCNSPATVSLRSVGGGLQSLSGVSQTVIHYTASVTSDSSTPIDVQIATATSLTDIQTFSGVFGTHLATVAITPSETNDLAAGNYADTLILTLAASM